ncbi:MAG: DUF4012 domain-containing protein [Actinobacteria bacterium]|nr:DUF4012 domain-containing protein [Actinomycetota bacterium]
MRSALPGAATRLRDGASAAAEGRYRQAQVQFGQAEAAAADAQDLLAHPSFVVASMLPRIEADSAAVEALTQAARLSARAGFATVEAGRALGKDGYDSVYRQGRVRFEPLGEATAHLTTARRLLATASDFVSGVPQPSVEAIRGQLEAAGSELSRASHSARRAVVALHALPSLLGKSSPQRYFLALQTPSEARGTGGLAGFYGVLEAAEGRMRLERIGPIAELASEHMTGVEAPDWFDRRYASSAGLRQWQQANLSPHFPVVSQVWLDMYESVRGERLDGVIAMDPVALGRLTAATGPIQTEGLDVAVGPDNAVPVLLHDSYLQFGKDSERQNRYLTGVTSGFWDTMASGDVDVVALATGAAGSVSAGHIKIYSRDERTQSAIATLDADGGVLEEGPNAQLVYHNNFAGNKVDYFLRRRIETTVRLDERGGARVRTTVAMKNEAPSGPPSPLLGPGVRGAETGLNSMLLEFLLPEGARVKGLTIEGRSIPPWIEHEGRLPAVSETLGIPAGGRKRASLTYEIPDAATWSGRQGRFSMTLLPHTTVTPDHFLLTVIPPEGYRAESVGDEAVMVEGAVRMEGELDGKKSLTVRIIS